MMKPLALACVPLLSVSAFAEQPAAAPATQPAATIALTDKTVTIDGALDDACWQSATPVEVKYEFGKVGVAEPKPLMTVKYAADANYLYIGYETFDRNLIAVGTGQKQGPKGNQREGCEIARGDEKIDVVEFFVSFGDPHFMWEIHQNALNQFNDIWVCVPDADWPINKTTASMYGQIFAPEEYLKDDGTLTVMTAVKLKAKADGKPSTPNDPSDEDTGYTGEIRIPWRSLAIPTDWHGTPPPPSKPGEPVAPTPWNLAGHTVSLMAVCQDGDLANRYHHSSPTFPGGWFHQGEKQWPVYRFGEGVTAQAGQ